MSVKAKFVVTAKTEFVGNILVQMQPVYGTSGENADFTKYTPSGKLEMNLDKDAAAASEFVVGESYYLTFEKAVSTTEK